MYQVSEAKFDVDSFESVIWTESSCWKVGMCAFIFLYMNICTYVCVYT